MSEILNNIYIDRFLLVAFVKYILSQVYSHLFGTLLFDTFWRLWKLLFFEEKKIKIVVYIFFIEKPATSLTQEWLVVESCPIGLQYILSFKWPDCSLKCRVPITLKGQSLKFKANVLYEISLFLKQAGIVIHFLNLLIVTKLLSWNRKER